MYRAPQLLNPVEPVKNSRMVTKQAIQWWRIARTTRDLPELTLKFTRTLPMLTDAWPGLPAPTEPRHSA